jgi:protein-S-isoprenylcysteine O-methyltransferase Ste14
MVARTRWIGSVTFGVASYLIFLAVVGYAVLFLAGTGVPRTVDAGGPRSATTSAALIDLSLLAAFAVQHSAMARPWFKRRWTRLVPQPVERSCYVLLASLLLATTFWQWRPIPALIWQVHDPAARGALRTMFVLGWLWALAMTFAIDHLDLVGLRQLRQHMRGDDRPAAPEFRAPWPYRLVRHPMMTGFFVAFLAAPAMSAGHLLFALASIAYVVVAVHFEEHDLTTALSQYRDYAARTPRFVPRPSRTHRVMH